MTPSIRATLVLLASVGIGLAAQQQPSPSPPSGAEPQQPRFRGGANLVRVDTYVTTGGIPVTDLGISDFEVLEDNVPQQLESFQLVRPRGPASDAEVREPNTVAESREMARDPDARVFVLFMDIWHVQIEGSYRAQAPLTRFLDQAIGRDDLVGVMHPEMAARNMAFARRRSTIAEMLKDNWYWGERGKVVSSDRREQEIEACYPDADATMGIAAEMIRRRRESKTLDALEDLIEHLEEIREERKFVFLLTEGWLLRGPDQSLARTFQFKDGSVSGPPPPPQIGVDPGGRMRMDPRDQNGSLGSCERERSMLAYTDHRAQFDRLVQRANRANVSFYPIDFRGLVAFDEPINSSRALTVYGPNASPSADAARLRNRHDALRVMAENTDGHAIVDTNHFDRDLQRVVQDTGAYYLLGYYSTNTKLDGRYRRIKVRVKREGVEIRSRPGYLAPTEAELASSRVDALMNGAPPGHTTITPSLARAFANLPGLRGNSPIRVQSAAAPSAIWVIGEIDAALAKSEWENGGRVRALFEHETGAAPPVRAEMTVPAGQRAFVLTAPPDVELASGRYVIRLEMTPEGSASPLTTTTDAFIPQSDWLMSSTGLTARRGPSTGLQYVPTADPRFRRTERIRLEVPRSSQEGEASARLLSKDGKPLNVAITLSERVDADSGLRMLVADLTLAPLAQGEYAVEISVGRGERKDTATYAFRLVP